jgi:hypothetical protein
MTFTGLLIWLAVGYGAGLLIGPFVKSSRLGGRDVSVGCGVAGGLGASAPYVLLHSIWVQYLLADEYPSNKTASLVIWLARNVTVACIVCGSIAVLITGLLSRSRPAPSAGSTASRHDGFALNSTITTRILGNKLAVWLLLCLPAVGYSLWKRIYGHPIGATSSTYIVGSMFVVGLLGYVVCSAVKAIRYSR